MLVLSFGSRQLAEQLLGNDVLNAGEVRRICVAVKERALSEVLVHLTAVMMRFHLNSGMVLQRVKSHQINVQLLYGRRGLKDFRSCFKRAGLRSFGLCVLSRCWAC